MSRPKMMPTTPDASPASAPPPPSRTPRLRWAIVLGGVAGLLGGPVFVGLLGAAVFIRRRAGSPIGLLGLALEPLVLLFCALVCGVDFYLRGITWIAPGDLPLFWLSRALLGLLLGVLVLGFVAWALGLNRR